jgi:transposase
MVNTRRAFGVHTWTYNQAVSGLRKCGVELMDIKKMRAYCVNADSALVRDKPWVTDILYDLRDEAAKDAIRAVKSMFTKRKNGRLKISDEQIFRSLKFRSKRDASRVLTIHSKHYAGAGVFCKSVFGKAAFRSGEKLPEKLPHDSKLQLTKTGKLYLIVPSITPKNQEERQKVGKWKRPVVSIDPGVRTFGTCYDGENVTEWGKGDMGKIHRVGHHIDKLQGEIATAKNKRTRRNLELASWRMRVRKANWVRDFHYRFAHWLCKNYSLILLPSYDTRSMISKNPPRGIRKINSKTVRGMMS